MTAEQKRPSDRPSDTVPTFRVREATELEARERFPKDHAAEQLVPILEKIPVNHAVVMNAPRSYVIAANAILRKRKSGMSFKIKTDEEGTWIYRTK